MYIIFRKRPQPGIANFRIRMLRNKSVSVDRIHEKLLKEFAIEDHKLKSDVFTFTFIRHPFQRIVSNFILRISRWDKILKEHSYSHSYIHYGPGRNVFNKFFESEKIEKKNN